MLSALCGDLPAGPMKLLFEFRLRSRRADYTGQALKEIAAEMKNLIQNRQETHEDPEDDRGSGFRSSVRECGEGQRKSPHLPSQP